MVGAGRGGEGFVERGEDTSMVAIFLGKAGVVVVVYVALLYIGMQVSQSLSAQDIVLSESKSMGGVAGALQGAIIGMMTLWFLSYLFLRLVEDEDMFMQEQLEHSRVTQVADRFNPLNLLLLMKVDPYLPQDVTGSKRPHQRPPLPIAQNSSFKGLLSDTSFVNAYQQRRYMRILRNRSFQTFARDRSLIDNLDKVHQETENDAFDWQNSAH